MLALPTVEDTRALGRQLAGALRAGDLVVLSGPLGAGKTALAQGIGAGLSVRGPVTSPTFVLARVHPPERTGGVPMVHVDAYRLSGTADLAGEIDALDLDATLDEAVTVVEWGETLAGRVAQTHLEVRLARPTGPDPTDETRTAELVPHGDDWTDRAASLAATTYRETSST